jgi:hypothetical protein
MAGNFMRCDPYRWGDFWISSERMDVLSKTRTNLWVSRSNEEWMVLFIGNIFLEALLVVSREDRGIHSGRGGGD